MAGIYSELLTVEGRPARVWRGGVGKPLVLLHGGLGDASTHWRWCWESLADTYAMYAPDLPGLGGMTAPLPDPGYQSFVDWTIALLDALVLGQVVLAGNSFGGAVARLVAARCPDRVSQLLLINGGQVLTPSSIGRLLVTVPGLSGLADVSAGGAHGPKMLETAVYDITRLTPEFAADARRAEPGMAAALQRIVRTGAPSERTPRCPTLIIWGTQDRLTPPKIGRELLQQIGGARFHQIESAGHMPQMEKPEAFLSAVRGFISP